MPDIDLVIWEKVKTGSNDAFEVLFRKYYPQLCLFSRRYTNDITTAREVIQDLFIYLWEERQQVNIHSSFKSYLFRAARYNSIRRMENEKRRGIKLDFMPESQEDAAFYDHLEYAELQEKIVEAISSLPEQCQKVFKLSRLQNLKNSDISMQLNISVKTVEAHITKAIRHIQKHLDGSELALFMILFFFRD